jgi:AcrR family transcriptional regulator
MSQNPKKSRRTLPADDRRAQILAAASQVFAHKGFAAARLEDVAERAQVAKGTIYLHFRDKEDLFTELIRGAASPLLLRLGELSVAPNISTDELLAAIFAAFRREILDTERKEILRLVIAEGPRFPRIAAFYYEEVVKKGLQIMRAIMQRAALRGEVSERALATHPQLIVAPLILSVIWDGLFGAIDPLDVEGLLATHRRIITGNAERTEQ